MTELNKLLLENVIIAFCLNLLIVLIGGEDRYLQLLIFCCAVDILDLLIKLKNK